MALLVDERPVARLRGEGEGPFLRYLEQAREEVNERIAGLLRSSQGGVPAALERHLMHGKRLRSGTALMLYGLLDGGKGDRSLALDLAVAVEVSHAVSLILDDMLDGDEERRQGPALHVVVGRPRAMLEVVGLLALPYSLASAGGRPYAAELARSHARLVEGARRELAPPGPACWEGYEELIATKTGELFALAARFGAAAAGAAPPIIDRAEEYGRCAGMAVQIADDLADLGRAGRGLPGRSEAVLAACLEAEGRGLGGGWTMLGEGIERARRAARALLEALDLPPSPWPSCLLSAPAEMAGAMLR